jgi:hypothetical protein
MDLIKNENPAFDFDFSAVISPMKFIIFNHVGQN